MSLPLASYHGISIRWTLVRTVRQAHRIAPTTAARLRCGFYIPVQWTYLTFLPSYALTLLHILPSYSLNFLPSYSLTFLHILPSYSLTFLHILLCYTSYALTFLHILLSYTKKAKLEYSLAYGNKNYDYKYCETSLGDHYFCTTYGFDDPGGNFIRISI